MANKNPFSPTFCIFPWIHLASLPSGQTKLCCVASEPLKNDDGSSFNLGTDPIEKIWNSDGLNGVRKKMLLGEPVLGCEQCDMLNSSGAESPRDRALREYSGSLPVSVKEWVQNFDPKIHTPIYYDLRLGNLCNLKCRSCCPDSSSKFQKEAQEISKVDLKYKELYGHTDGNYKWYESETFWKDIEKNSHQLKHLYLTGGEPMLIQQYLPLLKACIEKGYNKNIEVSINTNGTFYSNQLMNLLSQFRQVTISISIDGIEEVNDYLRAPSKWAEVSKNIEKFTQLKSQPFHIIFGPVLQLSNILHWASLFKYIEGVGESCGRSFNIYPILLTAPSHLSYLNAPLELRQEARERLECYLENSQLVREPANLDFFHRMNEVIAFLSQAPPANHREEILRFFWYMGALDRHRGQSLSSTLPDLYNFLNDFLASQKSTTEFSAQV